MHHIRLVSSGLAALILLSVFSVSPAFAANSQPTISSNPNLNAQAGAGYAYDVEATDPDGQTLSYLLLSAPSGMAIDAATGMASWTPRDLGPFPVVIAADDGMGGRTTQSFTITVAPGPAIAIRLAPEAATLSADETASFAVTATDALGHTFTVPTPLLTTDDPSSTIEGMTYRPGKAGIWRVTATVGTLTDASAVTVIPGKVVALAINPNSNPEVLTVGASRRFAVQGFDGDNNLIDTVPVTWSVRGDLGTIAADGLFTAGKAGEGHVRASYGDVLAEVKVTTRAQAGETAAPAATNAAPKPTATNENGKEETAPVNENVTSPSDEGTVAGEESNGTTCWDIRWWGWVFILVGYVILLGTYYWLIRSSRTAYWWVAPVVLTAAAMWLFFAYRCGNGFGWYPWLAIIGGIVATLFRPHRFESSTGQTIA